MDNHDHKIILGCSIPDKGGFQKEIDFETLSTIRKTLEDYINLEVHMINTRYNIYTLIKNNPENYGEIIVTLHIDLAEFIV